MYEPLRGLHAKHLSPYGRVVPFTYRDSRTFIQTLESMRDYLVNVIVPHIDASFSQYHSEVNSLVESLNAIIDEVNENVGRTADVVERGEELLDSVNAAIVTLESLTAQGESIAASVADSATNANESASLAQQAVIDARNEALAVIQSFRVTWSNIDGIPNEFTPNSHEHSATDIVGDVFDPGLLPVATADEFGSVRVTNLIAPSDNRAVTSGAVFNEANRRGLALSASGQRAVFIGASNVVPGTWPEKLSALFGWDCRNFAVGGTAFADGNRNYSVQYPTFIAQILKAAADPTFSNASVNYVFIAGGGNDARNASFRPNVKVTALAAFNEAKTRFPNARIIVVGGLWNNGIIEPSIVDVAEQMRQAAITSGCEYVEGGEHWLYGLDNAMADAVHPNATGYAIFTERIAHYLRGGNTLINSWVDTTYASGCTPRANQNGVRMTVKNSVMYIAGGFNVDSAKANGTTIMSMPKKYAPGITVGVSLQRAWAGADWGAPGAMPVLFIYSTGDIKSFGITTSGEFSLTASYVVGR